MPRELLDIKPLKEKLWDILILSPKKAWFAQQTQPFLGGREKQNGHVFDFEERGVLL